LVLGEKLRPKTIAECAAQWDDSCKSFRSWDERGGWAGLGNRENW
jgi:hypothetical protein